jgi:outer membrane immunogenic protein
MRRLVLAVVMVGTAAGAQAADMPDFLRGTLPAMDVTTRNWDGWYVGGQVGETWENTDYRSTLVSMTNDLFRNTTLQGPASQFNVLGRVNAQSVGFGAFVGRNYQFGDIVLGVEANYNYVSSLGTSDTGSLGPIQIPEPTLVLPVGATAADGVTLNGAAALQIKDEVTFRGRAGWAIGDFLPYAFGGVAVGRMDVSREVSSSVVRTINFVGGSSTSFLLPQFSLTSAEAKGNNYVFGWTGGLGLEYMLWGNVFVRGEWEYVKFLSIEDTVVTQNSVRGGIGYKF